VVLSEGGGHVGRGCVWKPCLKSGNLAVKVSLILDNVPGHPLYADLKIPKQASPTPPRLVAL
jgi:hypothetical protein